MNTTEQNNEDWGLLFDRPAPASKIEAATDLCQAIERVFKFPSDGITISWRGEPIRVPYVYGVSDALDNILNMLDALSADRGEDYRVTFSPDDPGSLDADWSLSWEHDLLILDADWRDAAGGVGEQTKGRSRVFLSKSSFARSWLDMLVFLCQTTIGVELEIDAEVRTIQRLAKLF